MTDSRPPDSIAWLSLGNAGNISTKRRRLAFQDVRGGLHLHQLAFTLAWLDIKLRYRGSVLGPFWLTLSTAIMILSMGVLYAELFHVSVQNYLPYLALSLILWNAIASIVSEACTCFTSESGSIHSIRMPFTVFCLRVVIRNAIVLMHNAIVIPVVFIFFSVVPGTNVIQVVPGLILWTLDAVSCCYLLGAVCARFRDVPPIVASVMQIGFFLTPIIWQPGVLGVYIPYLVLNPLYPLMAIVRDPLIGGRAGGLVWAAAICWTAALCFVSGVVFTRVRERLAFWV